MNDRHTLLIILIALWLICLRLFNHLRQSARATEAQNVDRMARGIGGMMRNSALLTIGQTVLVWYMWPALSPGVRIIVGCLTVVAWATYLLAMRPYLNRDELAYRVRLFKLKFRTMAVPKIGAKYRGRSSDSTIEVLDFDEVSVRYQIEGGGSFTRSRRGFEKNFIQIKEQTTCD